MSFAISVKVEYSAPGSVHKRKLPALLTNQGFLVSLLQYQSENKRSMSWRTQVNFVVKMLFDFIDRSPIPFYDPTVLLRAFSTALREGTVSSDLNDPLELYWSPRSAEHANTLIAHLTDYTDWLARQPGHSGVIMNPIRAATSYEEKLNWCAYHHRRDATLLNHLWTEQHESENRSTRTIARERTAFVMLEEVKRFPEDRINELLDSGFILPNNLHLSHEERTDWRTIAITLLLHWGGIRTSEAFHVYLNDIEINEDKNEAIVRIYHPSQGMAPEGGYADRQDYLLKRFRRVPRTAYMKTETQHAGWKAAALSDSRKFFEVQFFPPSKSTEFLIAFVNYLKFQRVEPTGRKHPYAFTNSTGKPETIKNYRRLYKAAVERIGLSHEKYLGTTPHGHRHSYGYRLAEAGFEQVWIQKCMHHKHPESSLVYTQPTNAEMSQMLRDAEARMYPKQQAFYEGIGNRSQSM